jgi:hypothetical protein
MALKTLTLPAPQHEEALADHYAELKDAKMQDLFAADTQREKIPHCVGRLPGRLL